MPVRQTYKPLTFKELNMSKAKKAPVGTENEVADTSAEEAEAKRLKAEEKAEAKKLADAKKAEAAEAKKAEKAQKEAEAKAKKEAEKAEKEAQKAAKIAAKEANKMPKANDVRRPKPDTLCGKAWAIFDSLSASTGVPATIGDSLKVASEQGLNEGNVRAEYARWRKFFGVSGRLSAPKATKTPQHEATETA